ncbi:unnamed protein product, partial [Mesorhabditis spiculigera]
MLAPRPMFSKSTQTDSSSGEKPPDTLLSIDRFRTLPSTVWLALLSLFSPLDLLNLAAAHPLLKDLISDSPKKWGSLQARHIFGDTSGKEHAKAYKITGKQGQQYLLAYGNEYGYLEAEPHFQGYSEKHCTPLRPGVDREAVAAEDLFILINNTTFDQFGIGSDWSLPAAEKYNISPHIHAHTVLLPIRDPMEAFQQIGALDPRGIAVHVELEEEDAESLQEPEEREEDEAAEVVILRATISAIMPMLPGLEKFWVFFGRHVGEVARLIDVKAPTITAHFTLIDGWADWKPEKILVDEFVRALAPTLQLIIEQWEKGSRQIDNITLISLYQPVTRPDAWAAWSLIDAGICRIAATLAEGKTDPYCIDWAKSTEPFWLIRRGPLSREGLLIGVRRESIFLIGCDYNLRRHRTQPECEGFVLDEVPYHEDLTQKECLAIALEERAKANPPDTVPMRERAIDRLLCPQFDWGPLPQGVQADVRIAVARRPDSRRLPRPICCSSLKN